MSVVTYPDRLNNDFKVKLISDDISVYKFIEFVIQAYIDNDERIMGVLKDYAPDNRFKTLHWYNEGLQKHKKEAEEYFKDMSLNEDDLKSIFDVASLDEDENS